MPRGWRWLGLAATAALLMMGCGSGGDDSTSPSASKPNDFAFTFHHSDGSVAPPYHAEWSIAVDATGAGHAEYMPDYAGDKTPTYTSDFTVSEDEMSSLYGTMDSAGLLTDIKQTDDPPIGGATETMEVVANGQTYEIPAFDEDGNQPLTNLSGEIVGLVPAKDWASFEQKRKAYAEKNYDGTDPTP